MALRTRLDVLWPDHIDEDVVVVARDDNFLRKYTERGTNASWPIVLAFKGRDIGQWNLMKEREPPANAAKEDGEENVEDTSSTSQANRVVLSMLVTLPSYWQWTDQQI
jgi:hypothetical protein